jgi:phosphate transport system permease protein
VDKALKQLHPQKFFTKIRSKLTGDFLFKNLAAIVAASAVVILLITGYVLSTGSVPVVQKFGANFFFGNAWNPVEGRELFGALPYVMGTLVTSGIALLIGVPIKFGYSNFSCRNGSKNSQSTNRLFG